MVFHKADKPNRNSSCLLVNIYKSYDRGGSINSPWRFFLYYKSFIREYSLSTLYNPRNNQSFHVLLARNTISHYAQIAWEGALSIMFLWWPCFITDRSNCWCVEMAEIGLKWRTVCYFHDVSSRSVKGSYPLKSFYLQF